MPDQRYRFIHFVEVPGRRTPTWSCRSNSAGTEIGKVRLYAPWRQLCFFPDPAIVLSEDCLADIGEFLRRIGRKANREGDDVASNRLAPTPLNLGGGPR